MKRIVSATLVIASALVIAGCGIPPRSADQSEWWGNNAGGASPSGRLYERAHVREDWAGATYSELQAHWGDPYSRFYWEDEYQYDPNPRYRPTEPTAAYVEVVRQPRRGQPGQVELIFFILDEDYRRVKRVEFSNTFDWDGGDVNLEIHDDW